MATIQDVAKLAGVSIGTVSRVINNSTSVRPHTREAVQQAIKELQYVPSALARGLRGKPANSVALIVSDVANPFFASLTRGVEDVVAGQGYSLVLGNADRGREKQRQYTERLLGAGVKGMIVAPAQGTSGDLKRLVQRGVHLVVVDWRISLPQADNVYADSVAGAVQLVSHLIALGHKRIGVVSGPRGDATAEDRVAGYRRAMEQAGLPIDPKLIRFGAFTQESGYANSLRLLGLKARPTALLTCNNRLAAGAYGAIATAGLRIPADVSLVSFDDIPFVPDLAGTLTVYAQPDYEMGRIAAELLFDRILERRPLDQRCEVVLQGRLIERSSSAPPPAVEPAAVVAAGSALA
ncbi:MAG: LacI family DNA-binding transcriptional regulator [Anaerolineae bacterium]